MSTTYKINKRPKDDVSDDETNEDPPQNKMNHNAQNDSTEYQTQTVASLFGDDVDWKAESDKQQELAKQAGYDPAREYESDKKEEYSTDQSQIKFPVQVFVRLRPLIKEEIADKHEEMEYKTKNIKKTKSTSLHITDKSAKNIRRSAIPKKKKKNSKATKKLKKFSGFREVFLAQADNFECFKKCILPSLDSVFKGFTVCSFAYGHTGSGKTHTIMGYHPEVSPGMYRLTAAYICDKLSELNQGIPDKEDQMAISCRFAELYQGKVRDLFGNLVECHIREDDEGNINIRGPTLKDEETGQVKVQPLTPVSVVPGEVDKLILKVTESLKDRKQGSSGVHDESSRSHVFLEMELVTKKLVVARENFWNAEAALVPVGKARDGMLIKIQGGQFEKDPVTNQWRKKENWEPDPDDEKELQRLQMEFVRLDKVIQKCAKEVDNVMKESAVCIGGTIVFVDLAGNEWGTDNKNVKGDNVQMSERKEINKSLLSLKECVRALHNKRGHVPYRNSKLTMALRPHLKGINSTAIMIANISPSQHHIQKTYNTLLYSQLVAKA
eukprot:549568_1